MGDSQKSELVQEKNINGIEVVLVKAGTFTMGSPTSEADRDNDEVQHQVTITKDFWISKYPITNAQYSGSTGVAADHPVVGVSWDKASDWAKSKGGRLPTEAEWEFAARGGVNSKGYIYSGSNNLDEVGWYKGDSERKTYTVGQKKANELGLYDMSGNVYEWCSDWYGEYPAKAVTDPTGPSKGDTRVLRGGGWEYDARGCRVAFRGDSGPSSGTVALGFRVVFDE
jgi:formylglycine-generating enzyme required for sulfatase activity